MPISFKSIPVGVRKTAKSFSKDFVGDYNPKSLAREMRVSRVGPKEVEKYLRMSKPAVRSYLKPDGGNMPSVHFEHVVKTAKQDFIKRFRLPPGGRAISED